MRYFKIVLLGSGGVGKSSLARQFVQDSFEESYDPTLEEIHRKSFSVDGELCQLELVDTAGMEQFSQLRDPHMKRSDGFILVYSIIDTTTFEDIKTVRAQIVQAKYSEQVPIVLVGNKSDLKSESERIIPISEGKDLAARWPLCQFVETSAKDHVETEHIFTILARQIISFQTMKSERLNPLVEEATKKQNSGRCTVM